MQFFLLFGAEAMILLEEAVIGIPIGEATRGSVPLIAEYVRVFLVHLDKGDDMSISTANTSLEGVNCLELSWNGKG